MSIMTVGMSPSGWITAAAVATLISTLSSGGLAYYWEKRKLNRSERSTAYSSFLDKFSQRWRAFADRDGAEKERRRQAAKRMPDASAVEKAIADVARWDRRANELRDELYEAYTRIQILSPQSVVEAALGLVRLSDDRNRAFKDPEKYASPANDSRSAALATFVRRAREDLGIKPLDTEKLRKDAAQIDRPWWAGGEGTDGSRIP